jgi:hypothetical protein
MGDAVDWGAGWYAAEHPEDLVIFPRELAREVCPQHVLHGRKVVLIARCDGTDDVLFQLEDGSVAQVHLTWCRETDPRWPGTVVYPDLAAWLAVPPDQR